MRTGGTGAVLSAKIKKLASLKKIIPRLQKSGKRIVFTNGCFDILHYGHVKYLEDAKKKGDILIVAINSDASIRRIKGPKRPLVSQADRSRVIAALESVDFVTIFAEETPLRTIRALCPDVLIKGADWKNKDIVGAGFIREKGGTVSTIKLEKGRSTTNIIRTIIEKYRTA